MEFCVYDVGLMMYLFSMKIKSCYYLIIVLSICYYIVHNDYLEKYKD